MFPLNLQYIHSYWSASIGHPYIAHAFSSWQADRAFLVVSINGRFICDGHCTYHHVMRASNFVCTLSYIHALTLCWYSYYVRACQRHIVYLHAKRFSPHKISIDVATYIETSIKISQYTRVIVHAIVSSLLTQCMTQYITPSYDITQHCPLNNDPIPICMTVDTVVHYSTMLHVHVTVDTCTMYCIQCTSNINSHVRIIVE